LLKDSACLRAVWPNVAVGDCLFDGETGALPRSLAFCCSVFHSFV
jgi:hypothetical protein